MSKRETNKTVELSGRKFKIEKFDALTGSYIAFILMQKFLPMGMEQKAGMSNLPEARTPMSKEEFISLQNDCLSVVSEVLPARCAPIINENGTWGVTDIEKDTKLVMLLTIHALTFNIAGFFDEQGLMELKTSLADISLVHSPT